MAENNINIVKLKQLTNPTQKRLLSNFMEDHPDFARGLLNNQQGQTKKAMLWNSLTKLLNSNGPPSKTEAEWRKVWQDQKWAVKRKLNYNKKEIKKTGGGPCQIKELTPAEEIISRSAGLEASVSGLNANKYGANVSTRTIQLECTPVTCEFSENQTDEINMEGRLDDIQYIDNDSEIQGVLDDGRLGTQDTEKPNKYDLLKKSLAINQNLLNSFQNIEKFLQNLQVQNQQIIELKKQKLAVLKDANILKRQQILELKRVENENPFM